MTAGPALLAEIAGLLREATGEDDEWQAAIRPDARLDGDLQLDSLELATLGELLRERYGDRVDLPGYLATLDLDELIALTVADVAAYVSQ